MAEEEKGMTGYSVHIEEHEANDGSKWYYAVVGGVDGEAQGTAEDAWEDARVRIGELNAAKEVNLGSAGC